MKVVNLVKFNQVVQKISCSEADFADFPSFVWPLWPVATLSAYDQNCKDYCTRICNTYAQMKKNMHIMNNKK